MTATDTTTGADRLLDLCLDAPGVATVWVGLYCRVSTETQKRDGTGLDVQETFGRGYVNTQAGWALRDVYADDATGKNDDRAGWRRALADAKAGRFTVLLVVKWTRFARDADLCAQLEKEMRALGVRVISLETPTVDERTAAGQLVRRQFWSFAEYEHAMILERCANGAHARAAQGHWPGGKAHYGYRIAGARKARVLKVDTRKDGRGEADALRLAAGWIVTEGNTAGQAARRLDANGFRKRNGSPWDDQTLRAALSSRGMVGEFTWGDTSKRGTGRWGGGTTKVLRFPGVFTEVEHAAILSALARTAYGPRSRPNRVYPLSGHIVGRCGGGYTGIYRNDRDKAYYRCAGGHARKAGQPTCGCPRFVAPELEAQVWRAVSAFLTDADRLEALARDYAGLRAGQEAVECDELADVRREIARLGRALDEATINGLREGLPARAVAAATAALQADLEAAEKREQTILAWQADNAAEAGRVRDLRDLARDATTLLPDYPAGQTEVYKLLGLRVILSDNGQPSHVEGELAWLRLREALTEPGNPDDVLPWRRSVSQVRD